MINLVPASAAILFGQVILFVLSSVPDCVIVQART